MKTMMKRILAFALAAMLVLGMTVTGAAADPALNQKLKINQVAAGDTVKAYRLVEYDAAFNGYTFYASFATFLEAEKNAAGFNSLSVQEYFTEKIGTTGVAELLGKYAAACAKDPATYTLPAVTDEQVAAADETVTFDALEPGLYLLSGQSVCVNRQVYTPSPLLIVCPAAREAEPVLTRSPEKADYSVQIVWDDEKTPEQRPGSLPVQLMCDGKVYGRPVQLSGEQDWRYIWSSLPTAHYWALAEQPVPGYLDAEIQKEGTCFCVTYAAVQPEPLPQPEEEDVPENENRGWLAILALMLLAAAGIFLRKPREKSKKA